LYSRLPAVVTLSWIRSVVMNVMAYNCLTPKSISYLQDQRLYYTGVSGGFGPSPFDWTCIL